MKKKLTKQLHTFSKNGGLRNPRFGFAGRVYDVVAKIPKGKTMTYKQVATKAGNPFAARAVGQLMSKNFNKKIPCHRVVRSDGKVGNYNRGGPEQKLELLREEGYN